jgi:hypothetical protein
MKKQNRIYKVVETRDYRSTALSVTLQSPESCGRTCTITFNFQATPSEQKRVLKLVGKLYTRICKLPVGYTTSFYARKQSISDYELSDKNPREYWNAMREIIFVEAQPCWTMYETESERDLKAWKRHIR